MIIKKRNVALVLTIVGAVTAALAATVEIPDILNPSTKYSFEIAVGTVISNNGDLVVFEGKLSLTTNIIATAFDDKMLASMQMYVQMKLFDDQPEVTGLTSAQAAVLAVFNNDSATEGTLYALNGSNPSQWQQLTNNAAPIAVSAGATNLITIVLRYPGTGYEKREYTVAISTPPGPQVVSQVLTSPVSTAFGITAFGVIGEGALASVANVSGDPSPLSASMDFSVYQSADGLFLVDIYTVDENGTDNLEVFALMDGKWVSIGTAKAVGSGSNHYQFSVSGLNVGESYLFKVVDEEGREHLSNGAIEVKSIVMDAVRLELDTFIIVFNSEDGRRYKLLISSDVATPIESWTAESVQVYGDLGWSAFMDTFQGTAGGRTQIRVPKNGEKAFFKVLLINEAAGSLNIP